MSREYDLEEILAEYAGQDSSVPVPGAALSEPAAEDAPSPAADAQYEMIMEPLGLSGMGSSSRKVESKRETVKSVDYDTPTFLRRRL